MCDSGVDAQVLQLLDRFDAQTASLEFQRVVSGALAFMRDEVRIGRASIALVRESPPGFLLFDTSLPIVGIESGASMPPNAASLGETVRQRRSIYRADLRAIPLDNPVDRKLLEAGLLSTFSTPMISGGRCIGTLNGAAPTADGISELQRRFLEHAAPRLAQAIENGLAVERITRSEAQLRSVFDNVSDGILVAERDSHRFVLVNRALCKMLGRKPDEFLSLQLPDLHRAEDLARVLSAFEAQARGEVGLATDLPFLHQDGSVVLMDVNAALLDLGGKACLVGVIRQASERHRLEHERLFAQKMDSVRLLASGLAHDFNNLLTAILGNISLAREVMEEAGESSALLEEAEDSCTRATRLTRELLTFAKGGAPVKRELDLGEVVREAALATTNGSQIQCEVTAPEGLWSVNGDEAQLAQVVRNLVLNAMQASAGAGVVRVALQNVSASAGDSVCVSVEDHGSGIDKEKLEQIFLPFFTTKKHSSGMGLPVAHSIISSHEGRIEASSEPGKGSVFRFWLPAAPKPQTAAARQASANGIGHRVLVMDDESSVRSVVQAILTRAGYDVTCVADGQAALEAFERAETTAQPFGLVILDLTVPGGMGGKEAAKKILHAHPDARILVSSGYSDDAVMSDPRSHGLIGVLPKPYTASALAQAVAGAVR